MSEQNFTFSKGENPNINLSLAQMRFESWDDEHFLSSDVLPCPSIRAHVSLLRVFCDNWDQTGEQNSTPLSSTGEMCPSKSVSVRTEFCCRGLCFTHCFSSKSIWPFEISMLLHSCPHDKAEGHKLISSSKRLCSSTALCCSLILSAFCLS